MTSLEQRDLELANAKLTANQANNFLKELNDLKIRINKAFPPNTFGLNKRQIAKLMSWDSTVERLGKFARSVEKTQSRFDYEDRCEQARQAKVQQELILEQRQAFEAAQKTSAIKWLQSNHSELKFGEHYDIDSAVVMANEISASDEIHNLKSTNEFIDFAGDDYCDDSCMGWDMTSKRCDCGNRRVGWDTSNHYFTDPYVTAVAD